MLSFLFEEYESMIFGKSLEKVSCLKNILITILSYHSWKKFDATNFALRQLVLTLKACTFPVDANPAKYK